MRWGRSTVTFLAVCAGILLLLVGVCNGEMEAVLRKAATVCLECIGIG